jgi:betaine reductase
MTFRVVHYINQFYANIGGEEMAHVGPEKREGKVGPGTALAAVFGKDAEIVGTVICGDNYFNEHNEEAKKQLLEMVKSFNPDALAAGPAFFAGRYGMACGDFCATVQEELGIPAVTGMFPENPGAESFSKKVYIVKTANSARGMKDAAQGMGRLLLKLLKKEELGPAAAENYLPRGRRKVFFHEKNGAQRGLEMLLAKMKGEPFQTEYEMPTFNKIEPCAPVKDIKKATIALITSGGIVPKGNPDKIRVSSAESYGRYDISALDDLTPDNYESIHGGYDTQWANQNPDVVLPLDVLRQMEKNGEIGKIYKYVYCTTGTGTGVSWAEKFGQEIGPELKAAGVDAAILTST